MEHTCCVVPSCLLPAAPSWGWCTHSPRPLLFICDAFPVPPTEGYPPVLSSYTTYMKCPGNCIYHTTFQMCISTSDSSLKTGGSLSVEMGFYWCLCLSAHSRASPLWVFPEIQHVAPTHLLNDCFSALLSVAALFPVIYLAGVPNEIPHRGFPGWKWLLSFRPIHVSTPGPSAFFNSVSLVL